MTSKKYGYIRVSTMEQNDDRQRIALAPLGIPTKNLYIDRQSGKDFERPAYKKLMARIKKGDIIYVKSIDRLGRNYVEIIDEWRFITREKGADIKVLDMPLLDTTYCKDLLGTFIADLVLQVLSFSAQIERDNMLQRQAEGIAAAKERGVKFGRKCIAVPDDFAELYLRWRGGEFTAIHFAKRCGLSRSTLFLRIKEFEEALLSTPDGSQETTGINISE